MDFVIFKDVLTVRDLDSGWQAAGPVSALM